MVYLTEFEEHCNWNRKESFIQVGETFSPDWEK